MTGGYTDPNNLMRLQNFQLSNNLQNYSPEAAMGILPSQQTGGFDWLKGLDLKGAGSVMQGLSGLGNMGLGVANYFQNKSNFDDMMDLQLRNFDEQKKAAALNASLEADRIARHRGGTSSDRTHRLTGAVAGQ